MSWQTPGGFQVARGNVNDALIAESRRAFMSRVYGWMFAGLSVTGMVALLTAASPQLVMKIAQFRWLFFVAQIGLVWFLSSRVHQLTGAVAGALFLGYSVLTGLTFSVLFYVFTTGSIASVFLMSAGAFGAMSAFATFTKKDLSGWSSFLFMGLIGIVIASIVQIFMQSPMMNFVLGCAGVLVFAGLTAYDTQKLREMHAEAGYESAASLSISGALMLYLDFINLFIALLRLFGSRR